MIRDILLLAERLDPQPATDVALALASRLDAHVEAVTCVETIDYPLYGYGGVAALSAIIEQNRREAEADAHAVLAEVARRAGEIGVNVAGRTFSDPLFGAVASFAGAAHCADLVVVPQPDPDSPRHTRDFVEAALFQTGRPVMVVPYVHRNGYSVGDVVVAWNGSAQSARAVHDALPLLRLASRIEVLCFRTGGNEPDDLPAADIAEHLARHELKVSVRYSHCRPSEVGNGLLSHVSDTGANLIVMGGYGHSRLREFVLGGVTDTVLSSMTVPVVMAH